VKATHVETVAFDAKCNHTRALYGRLATRFGHSGLGTVLGTGGAFFTRSGQKTEGKRGKATVLLTVAFFNESDGQHMDSAAFWKID
jgi:hypothetical protein